MPISYFQHNGKKIFFVDYTWCKNKHQMIEQLEDGMEHLKRTPEPMLALSDFTGVFGSPEFMKRSKEFGPLIKEKVTRNAVFGMTSLKRLLLNGYNRVTGDDIKAFATKEEALDWLTE